MSALVKSRPALFSTPMVRALLDGRKTQTRRVVKSVELARGEARGVRVAPSTFCYLDFDGVPGLSWRPFAGSPTVPYPPEKIVEASPYGKPGDTLWVREEHYVRGHWEPVEGVRTKSGRMKWRFIAADDVVRFDAPPEGYRKGRHHKDPGTIAWHKRLARFMPRRLSRITLEVTGVRVERVQDISEDDAMAEGVEPIGSVHDGETPTWRDYRDPPDSAEPNEWVSPRNSFFSLWVSINGADSWDANPWVWAISFRVVTQ